MICRNTDMSTNIKHSCRCSAMGSMGFNGFQWLQPRLAMASNGSQWLSMVSAGSANGFQWASMVFNGFSNVLNGSQRFPMGFNGFSRHFKGAQWFQLFPMIVYGFQRLYDIQHPTCTCSMCCRHAKRSHTDARHYSQHRRYYSNASIAHATR